MNEISRTTDEHAELFRLEARARADHAAAQQALGNAWTPEGIKEHYKSKVIEFEWDSEAAHSREDDLAVSVLRAIAADDVRAQAFIAVYDAHHATNPDRWHA